MGAAASGKGSRRRGILVRVYERRRLNRKSVIERVKGKEVGHNRGESHQCLLGFHCWVGPAFNCSNGWCDFSYLIIKKAVRESFFLFLELFFVVDA